MKLQKLIIHNIASIEDATIDFEMTPLSDSELFLITGKTGSGKSTLLDAICLALYASTPRLENTKMQGSTRDKEQKITVSDPRQLLRRNTGEGYVKLTFIGTDRVPYEAEWAVRRARGNASGNLQAKSWTLKDLSTNTSYTKDVDIRSVMASAIGLTFEQFCRTTMLAQGEFTRFLNSDDKDKAAILEKITGVNIYSEIGVAIFDITSQKLSLYKEAQLRADSIEIPSDEEIRKLEDEQQQYSLQHQEMEKERQEITKKISWLQQYDDVLTLVSEAQSAVEKAKEQKESEEYKIGSKLVSDWNESADARGQYVSLLDAEAEKRRLEAKMQVCKEEFGLLRGTCEWEAGMLAGAKEALAELQAEADKSSAYSGLYQNEQTVSAHLNSLALAQAYIIDETDRLSKLTDDLQSAAQRKDEVQRLYNQEEARFNAANEELKAAEVQLQDYGLPSYRKSFDEHTKKSNMLTEASADMAAYSLALSAKDETQGQIDSIQNSICEKQTEHEAAKLLTDKAEVAKNVAFDICEKQKAGIDDWAKAVRATLSVNDECPVCRHKVEVLPTDEEVDRIYAIAYDSYRKALDQYEELSRKSNKLAAELLAFRQQLIGLQETQKRNDDRVQKCRLAAAASLKALDLELAEGVDDVLAGLISETKNVLEEIRAKIDVGEQLERAVTLKRNSLDSLRKIKDKAFAALETAKNNENEANRLISAANAVIAEKKCRVEDTFTTLEELLAGYDCIDIDWHEKPAAYQKELHRLAGLYAELQTKITEEAHNVQRIQAEYDSLIDVVAQISREIPEWGDVVSMSKARMDNPVRKANAILAEGTTCKSQLVEIITRIHQCNAAIDEFLGNQQDIDLERLSELSRLALSQITEVNKRLEKIRTDAATAQTKLDEHNRSMSTIIADKPQFKEDESKDALETLLATRTDELRILSEKKGAVDQKLQQIALDKQKVGSIQNEINRRRAEWEEWDRLNSYFGDATGAKFRKIAQSYVLANLIRAANAYMKTLSDRYTLAVEPGEFVIMVEDARQGFAKRAVSTISGGESFLVSLSLALALSDIGHTLAVDILFIDEGFGTLSGDPLMNAIGTLKTLHRKSGRKVGIISHVEELKEKIPVQIRVEQESNSSKSTIKIV